MEKGMDLIPLADSVPVLLAAPSELTPYALSEKDQKKSCSYAEAKTLEDNESKSDETKAEETSVDIQTNKLKDLQGSDANPAFVTRQKWWQLWRPRYAPPSAPLSLDTAKEIPLATCSYISKLSYHWVTPIMSLGYQRPLQATDLWKMDHTREAEYLADRFTAALKARQAKATEYNAALTSPTAPLPPPMLKRLSWLLASLRSQRLPDGFEAYGSAETLIARMQAREEEWRRKSGRKSGSVVWALNDAIDGFWLGGAFKVLGDTSQLMTPLVTKALINYAQEVYAAQQAGTPGPNIGKGVAMAIGMFWLTVQASVCQHQFFFRSMSVGVLARAALIASLYRRAITLSTKARADHPNGKLMNHLSSDLSRIDYCSQWFHACWTAPIQLTVCLILLLLQLGPSALAGFSLFFLITPLQTWFMKMSLNVRKGSMIWTDKRSKLLQELLASMQIIKVFTYEIPFLKRLAFIRGKELIGIRKILIIRAANQAIAYSIPTLASVLAFVVYASVGNHLDPAPIFTSLSLFMLLRQPMMYLPRALSSVTDAQNAFARLTAVFEAETIDEVDEVDPTLDVALRLQNATFEWVTAPLVEGNSAYAETPVPNEHPQPFRLQNINLTIPRGKLVAVVGPVGSGKSSLLQGLVGEMKRTSGTVTFGGTRSYCQQNAWIQNTTVRDNILFGQPWDEGRYWQAIKDASLVPDLEILADGDLTEIGEKGVNLSGGQKQRINIARALYFNGDVVLFDDPLSAVDAHVGKALFTDAILGALRNRGKTVILVTHALHFLHQVDHIYTLLNGRIMEDGPYDILIRNKGPFYKLVTEFGGAKEKKQKSNEEEEGGATAAPIKKAAILTKTHMGKAAGTGKLEGRLMVSEKRKTGSVDKGVYTGYLRAGQASVTFPLTLLFAVLMQGSQVISTLWLTYWEGNTFGRSQKFYMGVYASLGISQAIFTFLMGGSLGVMSYFASGNLFNIILTKIFYSPMSVFDTQPLGRILGIFGKDIDTIDNQLADSLRQFTMTIVLVLGSIIIIAVFLHYFIPVVAVVLFGYWYFANFYRASSRELKRLDAMLRSLLYSHFSESLSGLATIRAYGEASRFLKENAYYTDLENRAYLLTVTTQRWLAIRLDFMGALLIFAVAIMAATGGGGLGPSQIGLCLSYLVTLVQTFSMMTRQSAEVENNMNSVERALHYTSDSLPQEPAHVIKDTEPPPTWPAAGAISMRNVVMSYRPGLPTVLRGISVDIKSGEKVGVIGRTGAGKTSITVVLYRLVELTSGCITIDGLDISKVGLNTLRSRIAIIPQEPILFSGTLRSNLDPFGLYEDALLYDAMKRSCLMESDVSDGRFTLDMPVDSEGSNLSVGERSLVSLARALVKNSHIVMLDEATAAVDLETDAKIQETIRKEFHGKTLLCIAHRLRTIISWDRILVLSAGEVAEFDTPLSLYDNPDGLFRSSCDRSNISRDEILRAVGTAGQ